MATKYFVHKTALTHTTGAWAQTIGSFSTYDLALTNFYATMKDNTSNDNVECVNCLITNEHGQVFKNDYFERQYGAE